MIGRVTGVGTVPFLDLSSTTAEVGPEVSAGWDALLKSGRFVGGEEVGRFESEWAGFCGTRHAVGLANGTDALHLAMRALGIGPGDEVIVPANTFVATVEAIVLAGARPRFADVDPQTGLITAAHVEAQITHATRAVVVVHLFGQVPDMDELGTCASEHGLLLLEDAAQAHGATWRGVRAGAFGAVGCFSFYPGKNLGAFGDAGAVVTSDPDVAERLRSMRDHGRSGGNAGLGMAAHYQHERWGTNSRLDTAQAIVLSAKLRRLDSWNESRRRIAYDYTQMLPATVQPIRTLEHSRPVHHLMVVKVRDRDRVREHLAAAGIGTGIHYPTPCHQLLPYRGWASGPLPAAERLADQILSLPMYPHLRRDDVERVCSVLAEATSAHAVAQGRGV